MKAQLLAFLLRREGGYLGLDFLSISNKDFSRRVRISFLYSLSEWTFFHILLFLLV